MKAKVATLSSLPLEQLVDLKTFPQLGEMFGTVSKRVAVAEDYNGNAVCFAPLQHCLIVSQYITRPGLQREQAQLAGDEMDLAIVREAQKLGVSQVLLVVPSEILNDNPSLRNECVTVTFHIRKVPEFFLNSDLIKAETTSAFVN